MGDNPKVGGARLLFGKMFPQNCMKMKEIGPRGRASLAPPLDPPMHMADEMVSYPVNIMKE